MADIWSQITGGKLHSGSWLGGLLPDFGATEALAQGLSNNQTTDLSNAISNAQAQGNNYLQTGDINSFTDYSKLNNNTGVKIYNWEPDPSNPDNGGNSGNGGNGDGNGGSGNGGTSQQDIINAYKAMGWTDENAILADYNATGGSKLGGSTGGQSLNDYMRGQIESGYNNYFNQLNDLYGGLDTQAQAQNQIAQNSYNQSISDLAANQQQGLSDLGLTEQKLNANQVKNLRDIASNIQNQYMAGNVMLGARGAGDSSAANQYAYALNRIGSKERGNVMNQTAQSQQEINNQKAKLNNIVTQETSRLDTELANTKQSISSWLAEQQNAIKQMIANGELSKSQDIANATTQSLNMAITAYQNKATEIQNKRSQLESWAMSNAENINQLKANMGAIAGYIPNMPSANAINGGVQVDSQGNLRSLFGYGSSDEEKLKY